MFPPQVLEHFEQSHNAGELPDATVAAQVENPACGDVMLLALRVRDGCVEESRYKAKGCVASIAAGSALTSMINGKRVTELRSLRREALVAELGGLTPESMHASHLAMDALRAALAKLGKEN